MRASFIESRTYYGSPRIHKDLTEQHEAISRKRVIRLMQEEGLTARVRKRYKVTTIVAARHYPEIPDPEQNVSRVR